MHITSCILSLLFHICILALALYFPFQEGGHRIDLDKKVYQVELFEMPQKDNVKESPRKTPDKRTVKKSRESPPPSPKTRTKPSKLPALKKENNISQKPRAKPTRIAKKDKPKPPAKVDNKKKSPQKEGKKKPAQNVPTETNVVSKALDEVKKSVASRKGTETGIVDQELASLRRSLNEGQYNSSSRFKGDYTAKVYGNIVEQEIKNNWRFPLVDSDLTLKAEVEVRVDSSGSIIDSQIIKPSGRKDFDNSVLRAVENTELLPPPPRKDLRTIRITFNLQERNNF